MKIALIQMEVSPVKAENMEHAGALIAQAAKNGADLVMLPEMFCCEYRNRAFIENREPADGPMCRALADMAKENHVWLIAGTIPELDGEKTYNTAFVYDRMGRQAARHRKAHLFDVAIEGGQHFKESDTFTAGDAVTLFDTEFGKMGLCVCFDIRFPELSRLMALEGAQCIFCPAAFNMTPGPAHWELLFRGRAVENRVFTAGCAPARDENGCYVAYANSMVVEPWGGVIAQAGAEETILYADLDFSLVESTRKQLPLMPARRTDIYKIGRA